VLASHPQVETTPLTAVVRGGAGEQWRTYDTALRALAAIESLTSIRLRPPQTQIQATIDGEIRWLPLDDLTTWWELPDTDQARSLRRRHCAHVYPNSTVRGISWGELVAAGATRVLRDWPSLVAAHITDYRRTAAARDRRMARLMVG
jgi:hypothetical protein